MKLLLTFKVLVLLEKRREIYLEDAGSEAGPLPRVALADILLLRLSSQSSNVLVLLFDDLISWQQNEVLLVQ